MRDAAEPGAGPAGRAAIEKARPAHRVGVLVHRSRNSWASTIAEMAREACGCTVESRVSRSYSMDAGGSPHRRRRRRRRRGGTAGERPSTRAVWITGRW